VKAAALSPPWFIRARNQGMRMLANAAELVREPQNGLVVTEERLNRQRDQVRHVIQAEIESIRFMRQNRAASVALSREWLAISPEEAEESYDFVMPAFVADGQVDVAGLERYIAVDKAEGTVPPTFQLDQIIETGIAPEAVRALDARR
jgi:ABC-type nitrate/sulfonate/bicarbonate transport system substrate-binding protein